MTMTIHSFLPEDERCEVLEVDVSPTRGSSIVFPCGTSGWPLASPQTPSLLQKDEEAYGHDYPFPFRRRERRASKREVVYGPGSPIPFSRRGELLLEEMRE